MYNIPPTGSLNSQLYLPKQGQLEQAGRSTSSWVLNTSTDGDSTSSLGNLPLRLTTLTVKKLLLRSSGISRVSVCAHHHSLGTAEKSLGQQQQSTSSCKNEVTQRGQVTGT